MAITRQVPRTIKLAGAYGHEVNDLPAGAAITPGHIIERYNDSGTTKVKKAATAKAADYMVALNQPELNLGIDDAYAAGDLVKAYVPVPGDVIYGIVASGVNVAAGAKLESAGDGTLRALTDGVATFAAVEACDNSAGPSTARIKAERL